MYIAWSDSGLYVNVHLITGDFAIFAVRAITLAKNLMCHEYENIRGTSKSAGSMRVYPDILESSGLYSESSLCTDRSIGDISAAGPGNKIKGESL